MEYKLLPLEIPDDNPFQFDALDRKQAVENVSALIDELHGPFVLTIDSPWGTGKTTFIRMMKRTLEMRKYTCIYFNAWETDFSTDPLVAFVGELGSLENDDSKSESSYSEHFKKAKKLATLLARKALPVAGKIASAGIIDLDNFSEQAISDYISSSITDAVDAYTEEKKLIYQFHETITELAKELTEEGKKNKIIVFVDELDRCKPTYAIELLERVKHLFNVPNVIFVLSLDKQQLQISLGAVYGSQIDSNEYLKRFFDLEFSLPKPDAKAFTKCLYDRFGFEAFFSQRMTGELSYEKSNFIGTFNAMSDIFGLSLRARENCFTRIRVAMMTTQENYFLNPELLTFLTVLKAKAPVIYQKYALDNGSSKEVIIYLRELPGGAEFLDEHFGTVMESYIIAANADWRGGCEEIDEYTRLKDDESLDESTRERANKIVSIVTEMKYRDRNPSLNYVVSKLELAAQFSD